MNNNEYKEIKFDSELTSNEKKEKRINEAKLTTYYKYMFAFMISIALAVYMYIMALSIVSSYKELCIIACVLTLIAIVFLTRALMELYF
ncbi:MAG: hypothetical protein IJI58_04380 [Bacilli bacterium]|nr:hypothetical protein [Bacilli bacterium]